MNQPQESLETPVVSIVTPCYNGERFIAQWVACLMEQTYPSVEVIFINDGSTDGSKEAFERESPALIARGYTVIYLEKTNGGAADAVNHGLKQVTGAYLMPYDVDDILMPEAIAAKAEFLTAHPGFDLVRNNGYVVREADLDDQSILFDKPGEEFLEPYIFDSMFEKGVPLCGSYMMRTLALFRHLKDKSIYASPYGQNLQLLVPVAYFGKAAYITRPLLKYVHYKNSHSHSPDFQRKLELFNGYENNAITAICSLGIPDSEKRKYSDKIKNDNFKGRFSLGIQFHNHAFIRASYAQMKRLKLVTPAYRLMYAFSYLPLGCLVIKNFPRLKRVSKRVYYRIFTQRKTTK